MVAIIAGKVVYVHQKRLSLVMNKLNETYCAGYLNSRIKLLSNGRQ